MTPSDAGPPHGRRVEPTTVPSQARPRPRALAGARRSLAGLVLLGACAAAAACGAKGPPLPPLQKVPAAAGSVAAARFDRDVYISFVVPAANIEGPGVASLDRVEVYGITLARPLAAADAQTEAVRHAATLISRQHVRVPPPPTDPDKPLPRPLPVEPGLDQGGPGLAREPLTDDLRTAVQVSALAGPPSATAAAPAAGEPIVAPAPSWGADDAAAPKRYYFVVGVTRTGRYGRASDPVAVPLSRVSSAPGAPTVAYDERGMKIDWTPAPDAHVPAAPATDVLPSRSLAPPAPPTRYDVFAVPREAAAPAPDAAPAAPAPLNDKPLEGTELLVPGIRFGAEQCFAVRPVDTIGTAIVRGPLSPITCETPRDTFPPAAPKSLAAVAGAGSISLIWEPNTESDLAGYVVLRGEAGAQTLTPITPTPIRETTYRDTTVRPGTRYVYAVVAVDDASPQNVSAQSARVEETARQ